MEKVMQMLKKMLEKMNMAILMVMVFVMPAWADIPKSEDFAKGSEDKGGFDTLFWLGEKAVQVIIIGITIAFVIQIAKGAHKKYGDIAEEKATWMDVGGHLIGGIALLTLAIVMFNWVGTWVA